MAEDTAQQKTEEPTERRLQEAREKGQVPRSRELNTLLSLVAAAVGLVFMGKALMGDLMTMMTSGLAFNPNTLNSTESVYLAITQLIQLGIAAIIPVLCLFLASAFLGPAAMGGLNFSVDALAPKLEKLDPLKGLKRMFGLQSLIELIKAICKFLLVAAAAVVIIYYSISDLVSLGLQSFVMALCIWANY